MICNKDHHLLRGYTWGLKSKTKHASDDSDDEHMDEDNKTTFSTQLSGEYTCSECWLPLDETLKGCILGDSCEGRKIIWVGNRGSLCQNITCKQCGYMLHDDICCTKDLIEYPQLLKELPFLNNNN